MEGGVGDEEEVAGECEEGGEREEGSAVLYAVLSGGREEEWTGERGHCWVGDWGMSGFKGGTG